MSGSQPPSAQARSGAASALFPWSLVPELGAGEKRTGYAVWTDSVLAGLRWPYIAVRGHRPGRAVAVVAAIHGGEYAGVLGAQRLGRVIDPARVHGALLVLPVVNLPAFWERVAFVSPPDGRNLNRAFPGKATGTFSEVLALRLMQDLVAPADAIIDLHGGDIFETLAQHAGYYTLGDAGIDALAREMAEGFGLPWAVAHPRPAAPRGLVANAALLGKAAIFAAAGGNALAGDDDVQAVYQGLVNALRALGVLEGMRPASDVRWLAPGARIVAPGDGLWRPAVALEQQVADGEPLGTLTDLLGHEIARLDAPTSGMVLSFMSALAVRKAELLVTLGTRQ
jgi:predicted deacylase